MYAGIVTSSGCSFATWFDRASKSAGGDRIVPDSSVMPFSFNIVRVVVVYICTYVLYIRHCVGGWTTVVNCGTDRSGGKFTTTVRRSAQQKQEKVFKFWVWAGADWHLKLSIWSIAVRPPSFRLGYCEYLPSRPARSLTVCRYYCKCYEFSECPPLPHTHSHCPLGSTYCAVQL